MAKSVEKNPYVELVPAGQEIPYEEWVKSIYAAGRPFSKTQLAALRRSKAVSFRIDENGRHVVKRG